MIQCVRAPKNNTSDILGDTDATFFSLTPILYVGALTKTNDGRFVTNVTLVVYLSSAHVAELMISCAPCTPAIYVLTVFGFRWCHFVLLYRG